MTTSAAARVYALGVDIIYADSLVAVNLIADYLLLLSAGRVAGAVLHRWRMLLAAALGALYALASVAPEWGFLNGFAPKIALGVGMSLISFGSERRFWRCCAAFFAMSALFGGAVWALSTLGGYDAAPGGYVPLAGRTLALSFAVCYAAVTLFMRRAAPKALRRTAELRLSLGARQVTLRALIDTGCTLADPATGRPAAVCDARAIAPLLGGRAPDGDAAGSALALSALPGLAGRVTLLPYSAVGGGGLICALRPDSAELDGRRVDILAAIAPVGLGEYDAVIGAEI